MKVDQRPNPSRLTFTVAETAESLGVSPGTVRRWIAEKYLPAKQVQNIYLIELTELKKFIAPDWPRGGKYR
jgi:excisionase family DNA binding protein